MNTKYTHSMVDSTGIALLDFATVISELIDMPFSSSKTFFITYKGHKKYEKEVMTFVSRDENGNYYLNDVEIGSLELTLQVYSLICAPLIKEVALDEYREDCKEDVSLSLNNEIYLNTDSSFTDEYVGEGER